MIPKTRTEWWLNKINTNKVNDTKASKVLRKIGWKVFNLWECELKKANQEKLLVNLAAKISHLK